MRAPHPLTFRPILLEKTWGGRRLAELGKVLPPRVGIGESWELADLDATSVGGGGGGAARSTIADGPLAGSTLREAMAAWGEGLLGTLTPGRDGAFPLLVKFLDAEEDLSVQVHPSPAYARSHPEAALKTESWYVLAAEPGAVLYSGLVDGVTVDAFARNVRAGKVVDHLRAVPARVGECHHLPSGTVHALGRGIAVAEVQTPSDTTFRLWDWPDRYRRAGRELHVEPALACARAGAPPAPTRMRPGETRVRLVDAGAYDLWELRAGSGGPVAHPEPRRRCTVLLVLDGGVTWDGPGRSGDGAPVGVGGTVLVPPAWHERIEASGPSRVLAIGFPGSG